MTWLKAWASLARNFSVCDLDAGVLRIVTPWFLLAVHDRSKGMWENCRPVDALSSGAEFAWGPNRVDEFIDGGDLYRHYRSVCFHRVPGGKARKIGRDLL